MQPRVFDERFPQFVLYVQDVEAAATHWRGVFLAASGAAGGIRRSTVAEDATSMSAGANSPTTMKLELHLGPAAPTNYDPHEPERYNVTTFGESDIPIDISAPAGDGPETWLSSQMPNCRFLAALASAWASWRDARVELHRRLAFPAACLVFALLGVPVGVRPRRGGRATGLILTLVLIGGYYFLFVTGAHMAQQGSIAPWAGNLGGEYRRGSSLDCIFLRRIENIRKPNRIVAWFEVRFSSASARISGCESDAAPMPSANGRR